MGFALSAAGFFLLRAEWDGWDVGSGGAGEASEAGEGGEVGGAVLGRKAAVPLQHEALSVHLNF